MENKPLRAVKERMTEHTSGISVLILTRNEQTDLAGCLHSVSWSDDVHVFDSFSTDRTAEIARSRGVNFTQRVFDSYSAQRNAALDSLNFRHEWIFILDADEHPTTELAAEMHAAVVNCPANVNAFRIARRDYLWGTWLKHAQLSRYYIRLVRREFVRYTREVNEVLEVQGRTAELKGHLDHFPFSKGIAHWIAKHNAYSTMEAEIITGGATAEDTSFRAGIFARDFHQRRQAQKALFYSLPARPLIKWLYLVFCRGAFLDGAPGITYATLQAIYEYFIVLKTRERQN